MTALVVLGTSVHAGEPPASLNTVPEYINYQGRLVDPNGVPYSNTTHTVDLRLYDNAGGGPTLWGEQYSMKTQDGHFSILLGSGGTTLEGAPDTNLWQVLWKEGGGSPDTFFMGVTVRTDASGEELTTPVEATPRQQFVTSPFAFRAHQSRFAGGARDEFQAEAGINTPSITSTQDVMVTQTMRIGAGEKLYTPQVSANEASNIQIMGQTGKRVDMSADGGQVYVGYATPDGSPPALASQVTLGYITGGTGTETRMYGNKITVLGREGQTVGVNVKDGTLNVGYTPPVFGHITIPSYGPSQMTIGHTGTDMNIQSDNFKFNNDRLFDFDKQLVSVVSGAGSAHVDAIDHNQYDLMVVGVQTLSSGYTVRSVYTTSSGNVVVYLNPSSPITVNVYVRVLGIRKGLTEGFTY